ncbi:hypothetical protein CHS0354_041342 [Potamilus streckersoni]|uniref:TATA box-binding protein-associated factor RNA polymerase I subunit B n=1 Tax=Potamilus streckersoni TaxID=2493646 RepID=A0AAE0VU68_9BIVA|nr:hypothetical protein CHS0354_041342 [Potamilus streckersoni]
MPTCTVCGDTEFNEEHGLFYCTTCSTQSQDIRVEEREEEMPKEVNYASLIKEKSDKQKEKVEIKHDLGRPWSIYEAFQIIIQHQVEALIKNGAKPVLKDAVFKLWITYLAKLGVAFTSQPKMRSLLKHERQREKYPGSLENPQVKDVRKAVSMQNLYGMSKEVAENQIEKQDLALTLNAEEFYEGDNPQDEEVELDRISVCPSSIGSMEAKDGDDFRKYLNMKQRERKLFRTRPERMDMLKTVCFCYLGLLFTNNATTLSDILRWIKSWKFPYFDLSSILPSDMKRFVGDDRLFGSRRIPTLQSLQKGVGNLAVFMELKNFPEIPMTQLISRYIHQLDLPVEMHGFVIGLVQCQNFTWQYKPVLLNHRLPFWEGMAMSYIIITLKLLLGLDDTTERMISSYAAELVKILQNPHQLFLWEDWCKHMDQKLTSHQTYSLQTMDLSELRSLDGILQQYYYMKRGEPKVEVYFSYKRRKAREDTMDLLQKPFTQLSEKWAINKQLKHLFRNETDVTENSVDYCDPELSFFREPQSSQSGDRRSAYQSQERKELPNVNESYDPQLISTLIDEDPVGFLLGEGDLPVLGSDLSQDPLFPSYMTDKSKVFQTSTLKYITNPDTFLDNLGNLGLTKVTINSCHAKSSEEDSESDQDAEEIEKGYGSADLFSSQGFVSSKKLRLNKRKKSHNHSIRESVCQLIKSKMPSNVQIIDNKRFEELIGLLTVAHERFLLNFDKTGETISHSMKWLIKVCSTLIGSSEAELECEVRKFEVALIADMEDLNKRGTLQLRRIRGRKNYVHKRLKSFT